MLNFLVVIVYFLVPPVVYTPKGILLPVSESLSATDPAQVTLFQGSAPSVNPKKIAYVNIQYHSVTETQEGYAKLQAFAKSLAAGVGANGIVVSGVGHTMPQQTPSSQALYILRGMAIKYDLKG